MKDSRHKDSEQASNIDTEDGDGADEQDCLDRDDGEKRACDSFGDVSCSCLVAHFSCAKSSIVLIAIFLASLLLIFLNAWRSSHSSPFVSSPALL